MAFKKSKITLAETGQFSKLIIDYINGADSLRKFYAYDPKIESFKKVIEEKSKEIINRTVLVEVLKTQYQRSNINCSNIDLLLEKKDRIYQFYPQLQYE